MKYIKAIIILMFLSMVIMACKKDINPADQPTGKAIDELVIPEGFNWATIQKFKLTVGIQNTQAVNLKSKISVFNGNPDEGGKLILSGAVSNSTPFIENLALPSYLNEIYLVNEGAYGGKEIVSVPVNGSDINYIFADTKSAPVTQNYKETGEIGPECNDCFQVISGSGSVTINGGNIFCVTDNFTGSLTFEAWNGGGTLKVCGTANVSGFFELGPNCHIIVTQNGSLTMNPPSSNGTTASITVYENASLTINGNYQTNGAFFINQGALQINGNLTVQNLANLFTNKGNANLTGSVMVSGEIFSNSGSFIVNSGNFTSNTGSSVTNTGTIDINAGYLNVNGGTFDNNGIIAVDGDNFRLNVAAIFTNNGDLTFTSTGNRFEVNGSTLNNRGQVTVSGNMSFNSSSTVSNTCGIICSGQLEINSSNFTNTLGYLKGAQEVKLNSTGTIYLNDHSMISTVNLIYNQGTILGSGALNSIKVTGTFSIYNLNTYVSGSIETVCENFNFAQGNQATHFINGATIVAPDDITNYIEVCACNPEGIRNPIIDTDNDGVTDDLDDYPLDPTRAFNSFFPSESSYASLVFEDLWPAKGDYDFNDLVLGVTGYEVTNANNELIDLYINFNVRAVGASLKNGFGWQFAGITPNMIGSVTGAVLEQGYVSNDVNGTELGQDSAVIIACENVEDVLHRAGGSMFNTLENGFVGTSDVIEIHVIFDPPINQSLIGPDAYTNVFLIKNQDRSVEIHLPNRVPTDEMNMSLLGTGQDASDINEGRYYKTATGLPWGLLLLEPFDYPIEKSEVTEAYLHFAEWAESGGVDFQDWYSNKTTPGYRDNSKIYGAD